MNDESTRVTGETTRVIFDCDPGIGPGLDADDWLALCLLLASPEARLVAVTTVFGNVAVDRGTDNVLRILELVGRTEIPVGMGMSLPLTGKHNLKEIKDFEHQDATLPKPDLDRLKNRDPRHAVDIMIETVMANPGEITLIAVGPLTNVAMAILKEPGFAPAIKHLYLMGAAFGYEPTFGRGNITPVAELNIWNDPLAAEIVFQASIPTTVASLDICNSTAGTVLYTEQLTDLMSLSHSPFANFFGETVKTYIDSPKFQRANKGCVLYDPAAVAAFLDPTLLTTVQARIEVQTSPGPAYGQTVAYLDPEGNVATSSTIDAPSFIDLFLKRISSLLTNIK